MYNCTVVYTCTGNTSTRRHVICVKAPDVNMFTMNACQLVLYISDDVINGHAFGDTARFLGSQQIKLYSKVHL